jgi:transposase
MIYARQPTQADRLELQRMTRQAVGRVSQRAQMILLSIQQRTVPALAPLFPRSRASVRCWSRRFNAQGPAGLYDDPRRGRPRQVSPQVVETIVTRLPDDPRHAGSLATYGTVVMVGAALVHQLGGRLRTSTWRNALQRRGLRWGRPRLAMALTTDPAKAYTQWVMAKAVSAAGPQVTLRSGEESRVPLLPLMRAMWHWVGQPRRLPPLAPRSHAHGVGRGLSGPDGGCISSGSGCAPTISSPAWSTCWWAIRTVQSCSCEIISAVTQPQPSTPGGLPTRACTCTTCPRMVRM